MDQSKFVAFMIICLKLLKFVHFHAIQLPLQRRNSFISHLDLFKDRGIPEVYGAVKLATRVEGSSDYLMNFQVLLLSLRQLK